MAGSACASRTAATRSALSIAHVGEWALLRVLGAFVCRNSDDLTVDIGDDHSPIEIRPLLVVAPGDQTGQNLGHFVEPDRALLAEVELLQRRFVAAPGVTKNHRSARPILTTAPRGDHFFADGAGVLAILRPLAMLRRGRADVSASAAEMRWMVDQRASSRPFSMREMSA